MTESYDTLKSRLLDAILMHVPFDGWSDLAFRAAADDCGIDLAQARAVCPRGAVDLALASHDRGDEVMLARLRSEDLSALRFRDRIAAAVRFRLEAIEDREVVRKATALFALPIYAPDGTRALWSTADKIWVALGDTSDDVNWYTKRATLGAVVSATLLYWLGDDSEDHADSWAFLDRRIDDVMQIETVKAKIRDHPVLGRVMAGPNWLAKQIRPPMRQPDLPGMWSPQRDQ